MDNFEHDNEKTAESENVVRLDLIWQFVNKEYEIEKILGKGSFGFVIKAKHRKTGAVRAIKHIRNVFETLYEARKLVREI